MPTEIQQQIAEPETAQDAEGLEKEIAALKEREKRLVHLYSIGELDERVIEDELRGVPAAANCGRGATSESSPCDFGTRP